jgi:hypothetical protein
MLICELSAGSVPVVLENDRETEREREGGRERDEGREGGKEAKV